MIKIVAKITGTFLGIEDHGIFTWYLELDYGHSSQAAGTHMLSYTDREKGFMGSLKGIESLKKVLSACGVDSWEKLKGRTIYALKNDDDEYGLVQGLAPLPTERGKEFIFKDLELWPKK